MTLGRGMRGVVRGREGEGRNLGRRRRDRLLNFYERLFILAKFAKIATLLRSFFLLSYFNFERYFQPI